MHHCGIYTVFSITNRSHEQMNCRISVGSNTNGNVYGAVIMTEPLREFTRFIWWMQTERWVTANLQTEPTDLGWESVGRLLRSASNIAIFYFYSARKLILILLAHGGWKVESIYILQPVPNAVRGSDRRDKHTTHCGKIRIWDLSHRSHTCYHVDHCDLWSASLTANWLLLTSQYTKAAIVTLISWPTFTLLSLPLRLECYNRP